MIQGIGLYYGNWHQKYAPDLAKRLKEIVSSRDSAFSYVLILNLF